MSYLNEQGLMGVGEEVDLEQTFYEIAALMSFYEKANRQGLRVPDVPHSTLGNQFFMVQDEAFNLDGEEFIEKWSDIAAVAQHYGIPTRMLDWSFDMNTALFFAVQGLSHGQADEPECVSLWILDKSKASFLDKEIRIVVPKYCDNPNIKAQSGLFTLLVGSNPGKDLEEVIGAISAERPLFQHLLKHDSDPVLKKIDIPRGEALKLKDNLEGRGIGHDSFFPDWSGIVKSMRIRSGLRNV